MTKDHKKKANGPQAQSETDDSLTPEQTEVGDPLTLTPLGYVPPVEVIQLQWELEIGGTIVSIVTPSNTVVAGSFMKIDAEFMTVVDAAAPDRLVVTRASFDTLDAFHAIGAKVSFWTPDSPPSVVPLTTSDTLLRAFVKALNGDPRSEWVTYLWEQAKLFIRDGVELDIETLTDIETVDIVNIPSLVPPSAHINAASIPPALEMGPQGDVTPPKVEPEKTLGQQYLELLNRQSDNPPQQFDDPPVAA